MTPQRVLRMTRVVGIAGALTCGPAARVASEPPASPVKSVQVILETGGRVGWSHVHNRIALDQQGEDGAYDVYTMNPDGSDLTCLTCDKGELIGQGMNGNPAWHPSGEYIVFQSEKREHPGLSIEATPGFGRHSDLWLTDPDGTRFWQLTDLPATLDDGVLHPHFSHDGRVLSWTQMKERPRPLETTGLYGYWVLKVADFAFGPEGRPELSNIREFEPGGPGFYENHGFSQDGRYLLFTSNFRAADALDFEANDIYRLDLRTGEVVLLAEEGYNEHALWSPNGKKVLYMSSARNRRGTDYWLMNPDGTDDERITFFNSNDDPLNRGRSYVCADAAWSKDGRYVLGFVQTSLIRGTGLLVLIELNDDVTQSVGAP